MGIADADSEEHGSGSTNLMVTACKLPQRDGKNVADRTELVRFKEGSRAAKVFGKAEGREEYLCNYEFNRQYQEQVDAAGLKITGVDERGVGRVAELPEHPFFIATLFLPQMQSNDARPHPYLLAFLDAASHVRLKSSSARIG